MEGLQCSDTGEMEHLSGNITIGFLGSYINIMEKRVKEVSSLYGSLILSLSLGLLLTLGLIILYRPYCL